jgi:GNAT superfamily N-acetyltransferase
MRVSPQIRRGVPDDVPLLLELVRQYWHFEGIPGFDAAALSPLLKRLASDLDVGAIWIADADGDLLGYLIAVRSFSLEQQGPIAEIDEFFVSPTARTYGVGAALLDVAESDLACEGYVCLQLQLGKDNVRGRAFYRRHGYSERAGYELLDKRLTGI